MGQTTGYRFYREGEWRLRVLSERWSRGLWEHTQRYLTGPSPRGHPRTERFTYSSSNERIEYYLKIYPVPDILSGGKDLFRRSKALRALMQMESLSHENFPVPVAVAAGEQRSHGFLNGAFLLTVGIDGLLLPLYLQKTCSSPLDLSTLRKKRRALDQLAIEIARLHRMGFVHGDLIPSNILVLDGQDGVTFVTIDHDRTRRYPSWFPHGLWRRNLIQLNRVVLARISLQDRLRFLRIYLGERGWSEKGHRLNRWLEKKTRRRRKECSQAESPVSFRELMRWNGP